MVPEGLVLLTSLAFAAGALRLARRRVLVPELAAIEGLARADVLCVDKTGTLTKPGLGLTATKVVTGRPGAPVAEVIGALAAGKAPNETGRVRAARYPAPARGLASFCRPAKQNVNPRKARSGSNAQPNRYGTDDAGTDLDVTCYPPGLTASQWPTWLSSRNPSMVPATRLAAISHCREPAPVTSRRVRRSQSLGASRNTSPRWPSTWMVMAPNHSTKLACAP
jgi:hypothetical protein